MFVCPSDNRAQRSKTMLDNNGGRGNYPYSYSLNELFGNPIIGIQNPGSDGVNYSTNMRFGGKPFNGRISSIKQQHEKVLLVCEDEQTIDDGQFRAAPGNWNSPTGQVNAVASRHMTRKMTARNTALRDDVNRDARGNVGFIDGHVEFFNRKDALRARHSGRPDPDPAGF
jgi:prepilin-type processing-associated H-X9-DG protein